MDTIIFGDGGLGTAIATTLADRGTAARVLGRPPGGAHEPAALGAAAVAVDASAGAAVLGNVEAALAAGCRRFVIATTAWDAHRAAVDDRLRAHRASAVASPNFSLGAATFARIVERATELLGPIEAFEPLPVPPDPGGARRPARPRRAPPAAGRARGVARRAAPARVVTPAPAGSSECRMRWPVRPSRPV